MHTYIKRRDELYTVGFASAEFKKELDRIVGWYPIADVKTEQLAINLVSKLNGGS